MSSGLLFRGVDVASDCPLRSSQTRSLVASASSEPTAPALSEDYGTTIGPVEATVPPLAE